MLRRGAGIILGATLTATIGAVSPAHAAPVAPAALKAPPDASVDRVSFWGKPFPYGYAYRRGQCYLYVWEETPRGILRRRVWICTEPLPRPYALGGRF
jgi:hypothetical protein